MFTGIVQDLVKVVEIDQQVDLHRLKLALGDMTQGLELGASVAVNGTCLTVTAVESNVAYFDVIKESLGVTNLGDLEEGDLVNVERSFKVGDEVGGHIVSGHITATGVLSKLHKEGNDRVLTFSLASEWMRFVLHKGYVALDGASITISSVDRENSMFSVSLIPETIERTTLGRIAVGERVNIEVDSQTQAIVETIERVMADPAMLKQMQASARS